jgi:hypothetical protein
MAKKTDSTQDEIALESFKTHDAINIKGKVSAYWHIKKSDVRGLKLTALPSQTMVKLEGDGIRPLLIPFANIPFMTPLETPVDEAI